MKLTIIREDGAVYKDGVVYLNLDLSDIPVEVHALQFNNASNKGWIEFTQDDFGSKSQNKLIEELPVWAISASQKWDEAQAAEASAVSLELAPVEQPTNLN